MSEKDSPRGSRTAQSSRTELGPWLKAARLRRETTQAELARLLRTEQSMIAMVERGEAEPSAELAEKIRSWIRSGTRPGAAPKRGPYRT